MHNSKKIKILPVLRDSFFHFNDHNGLKLSAALSYYTVFSIAPFLIIIISIAGIFFGRDAVQGKVYGQIMGLVGSDAALQVQSIIKNMQGSKHTVIGGIIGVIVLVIGASGVFSEIQGSINYLWSINPSKKKGILLFVIRQLLSFSLLLSMAFILMVSLAVNAVVDVLSDRLQVYFPNVVVKLFYLINTVAIFLIITFLFTLIFKILPNAVIRWKHAILGATITSLLFLGGKFLIGFYLGNSRIGLTYGTAASIVLLMIWVYYSSIILYFGACFTKIYSRYAGAEIRSR